MQIIKKYKIGENKKTGAYGKKVCKISEQRLKAVKEFWCKTPRTPKRYHTGKEYNGIGKVLH